MVDIVAIMGKASPTAAKPKTRPGKEKMDPSTGSGIRRKKRKTKSSVALTDPRFSHIVTDKRFKPINRNQTTVKVDSRFKDMFTGEDFQSQFPSGAKNTQEAEELKRLYTIDDGDQEQPGGSDATHDRDTTQPAVPTFEDAMDEDERFAIDYSRGEVLLESSDEDEDDAEDVDTAENDGMLDVFPGGVVDGHEKVPHADEVSRRVAVCNIDWTSITAADLFVLANSFKTPTGAVESVVIYPSDFGLEAMAQEAKEGPVRFLKHAAAAGKGGQTHTENSAQEIEQLDDEVSQERLRLYELSKLRYYYAIITCDAPETAAAIYEQCDGLELEKSQSIMDIRFVPDDVEFDNKPKDTCTELPSEIDFGIEKLGQAPLAHSNLKCTWDEDTEKERMVLKKRKFSKEELEKIDYSNYLASDTEDSDSDDGDNRKNAFRALVEECQENEDDSDGAGDMEVTWAPGLHDKTQSLLDARQQKIDEKSLTMGEKLEKKRRLKKQERKKKIKEMLARGRDGSGGAADETQGLLSSDEDGERVGGDDDYFKQDLTEDWDASEKTAVARSSDGDSAEDSIIPRGISHPRRAASTAASDCGGAKHADGDEDDAGGAASAASLALMVDGTDDSHRGKHFDMTKIIHEYKNKDKKKKAKRSKKNASRGDDLDEESERQQDAFQLNLADARFAAIMDDKDFSLDPTQPEFKKTREMERLIADRQKKIATKSASAAAPSTKDSSAAPLSSSVSAMVRKIKKRKTSAKLGK
eukprot:m.156886 g.156886  ORF g.156886 m.156886 type:complete len:753 (+) comp17953_c0_seq2:218-2476(+)